MGLYTKVNLHRIWPTVLEDVSLLTAFITRDNGLMIKGMAKAKRSFKMAISILATGFKTNMMAKVSITVRNFITREIFIWTSFMDMGFTYIPMEIRLREIGDKI